MTRANLMVQLFRPSRPDFIETKNLRILLATAVRLFRPSRPDFIETGRLWGASGVAGVDCSGLLGRTSLRHENVTEHHNPQLYCSGLLGRTSLRRTACQSSQWLGLPIVPAF